MIESLSLIDAVMPDVVESRKAAAAKSQQIKTETNSTNGDDGAATISKCSAFCLFTMIMIVNVNFIFILILTNYARTVHTGFIRSTRNINALIERNPHMKWRCQHALFCNS